MTLSDLLFPAVILDLVVVFVALLLMAHLTKEEE